MSHALLVELQTEELPPKALRTLGDAFATAVADGLRRAGLIEVDTGFEAFATPRRLAVLVPAVRDQAADREVVEKLMPASVGLDADGKPTPALAKRLEKSGRATLLAQPEWTDGTDRVYVEGEGKAATLHLKSRAVGRRLDEAIDGVVADALAKLPIPKRMTYQRYDGGDETTVEFVRPAHRLVVLHGADVVKARVLGIASDRVTAGHRFLGEAEVTIPSADDYADALRDAGKVIASFDERGETIRTALAAAAGDDRVIAPDALVDEVTALVEWPVVYAGSFDEAFLAVPQECLILTMQQNQKYFALTDAAGAMVNRFLVVSNLATDDPQAIVGGNERVLRARLADAKFFFDQDRKKTLASRVEGLASVVYHNKLGSQLARVERVEALAGRIAGLLGHDADQARRAARLAKSDLLTDMVGEFPELQGLMGRYYATHDGEPANVAAAIEEQYKPRFSGDTLPATDTGVDLALADKLETLVGMFSVGGAPTGDKDPFALRRHALGVIRILIEKGYDDAALDTLVDLAREPFPEADRTAILQFLRDRLAGYLREEGYTANEIAAVIDLGVSRIAELPKRLAAVRAFAALPEAESLAAANKRVGNILRKSDAPVTPDFDHGKFAEAAERDLADALARVVGKAAPLYQGGDYSASLQALAQIRTPVDAFFDHVMVNAEDPVLRDNRLRLLAALHLEMNRVADISKLAA